MNTCILFRRTFAHLGALMICALCLLGILCCDASAGDNTATPRTNMISQVAKRLEDSGSSQAVSMEALARLHFAQGRYGDCDKICGRILEALPDDTNTKLLSAIARVRLFGDSGWKDLLQLAKLEENNQMVQLSLVRELVRHGRWERAEPVLEELLRKGDLTTAEAHYLRAMIRFRKGHRVGAKESILRFFSLVSPSDVSEAASRRFDKALSLLNYLQEEEIEKASRAALKKASEARVSGAALKIIDSKE